MKEFTNGAEAIARAALDSGCTFFAGYPITPATPILLHMVEELPKVGGVAIQGEDEIASIGFCVGAAMTGARAMTATSGPGISLYSETIGLAIIGEVPLVIVDVQRLGPSTGGATTVAQGDTQFLRWGTGGGYPVIVLAPTNVPDCYNLTRRAFDLAERYRTPVFLATDKETVASSVTVPLNAYENFPVRERTLAPADNGTFTPYRYHPADSVPPMAHLGGPHMVRFTGSSHDERGYLSKNPRDVGALNAHLAAKIDAHADEIALVESDLQDGAETLVISYGLTARSAREAVRQVRATGTRVSMLTVYTLWPVPETAIRAALTGIRRVIVPELNLGQYRREIERVIGEQTEKITVTGVHRVDGELITPDEIIEALA
ncbi:MAG: 2-oxoacid:acceptor oxidoreductase subunit alpha [Anaerolineae bacterium]|nr:2-oxoacid:acceptor oxidoreductase subunit alpha [Anaerolineae bacterium]